ncbi:hypothetical protein ACFPER_09480 [Agromyces aurantiacus]|uniref:Cell division protein FtsK n=1 Tax=Agromyces aurantiacus TaxID=165814 RepID=A0ABV9R699_9MICO|nr:hypothetical protein [Agromyces aurantiacus]MBM7503704.1 hypothetical protein [Agromyces aurantiacus]
MPDTDVRLARTPISALPGADVLWRVRRLLGWALGLCLAYSVLGGAGTSRCPGGFTGDGGYLDASGRPTDVAPECVTVTLEPAGFAYAVIAIVVFVTITRVVRHSVDQADAIRRLDRAVVGIVAFVIIWLAVTHASFASISLDAWDGTEPFFLEGTHFGTIVVDVSPMQG